MMKGLLCLASLFFFVSGQVPFTFKANSRSGWNPPDEGLAVSETRLISCVNGRCDLFSKPELKQLNRESLLNFFKPVRISTTFDPRGFYDRFENKMVFVSNDGIRKAGSQIVIAVSKTSEPNNFNTDWWTYAFRVSDSDAVWGDFPSIGYDYHNIYISANMFTGTGAEGVKDTDPRVWVIPKKDLYSGAIDKSKDIPRKVHKIKSHWTMVPATTQEKNNKEMHILSLGGLSIYIDTIINVENYNETKVVPSKLATGRYSIGSYPNQKGGKATVNTGDWRPQSGFQFENTLWLVSNRRNTGKIHNSVMWFKVTLDDFKLKYGFIDHPKKTGALFYPAIIPDKYGNVNMIMNGVDPDNYISSFVTSICTNGTVLPLRLGKEGEAYFTSSRYGDYNAIAIDPVDDTTVWGMAEIPVSGGWGIYGVMFESLCNSVPVEKCKYDCGKHGTCERIDASETWKCVCATGWTGEKCDLCLEDYYGPECAQCPDCKINTANVSWEHGKCDDGKEGDGTCECQSNWVGETCEECAPNHWGFFNRVCRKCPDCGPNGSCDEGASGSGKCVCETGWVGAACNACTSGYHLIDNECVKCPDCGTHGKCVDGTCECDQFFTGDQCDACETGRFLPDCKKCPDDCGAGSCVDGNCVCETGWEGTLCDHCNPDEIKCGICNCGPNGHCVDEKTGECVCREGWSLPICENCTEGYYLDNEKCVQCPDCGDNGHCTSSGECQCDDGWTTVQDKSGYCNDCKEEYYLDGDQCLACPACTDHGDCSHKGRCECETGWGGALCDECAPEYYGPACADCPDCGLRGVCNDLLDGNGECECETNWVGDFCDECAPGNYGPECIPCPTCSEHGTCHDGISGNGTCECDTNWSGNLCDMCEPGHFGKQCIDCAECQQGLCRDSVCQCTPGWIGLRCGQCVTSNELTLVGESASASPCGEHGICRDGGCECEKGWFGHTCEECVPGPDCQSCKDDPCICKHGKCTDNTCECDTGWSGSDCNTCSDDNDSLECPWLDCGDNGRNVAPNECKCNPGWEGKVCGLCTSYIVNAECAAK